MNVIDMVRVIRVVADRVLPISSLPKSQLAIWVALNCRILFEQPGTEIPLYATPSRRKIVVVRRLRKYGVQVIGRYDDCVDCERVFLPSRAKRRPQDGDVIDQGSRSSVSEGKRKEESARPEDDCVDTSP
jgi:hypothetical protein